jgi:hypothetical protein
MELAGGAIVGISSRNWNIGVTTPVYDIKLKNFRNFIFMKKEKMKNISR